MNKSLSKENLKAVIAFIFVISGAAGLIYQIVWFKYLALFLGNSTYAQMTVLATFLGGLALGNNFFGNRADRFTNPVKVYALLEIFVGLYCFAYPWLNSFVGNQFLAFSSSYELNPEHLPFNILRFTVSVLVLLLPTFAMGGTLPVLSRFFVDKMESARRETAILYYLNSFGAVGGVFIGGFFLIKELGLETSTYSAAVINLLAGIISFVLSKQISKEENTSIDQETKNDDAAGNTVVSKAMVNIVVIVAGISGAAALLYEMVWTRLLINFLGSSTYAFSIMLMSFISGITLGGWIVSQKFLSRFDKIKTIAFFQFVIAVSTMLVLFFYERLPYVLWKISYLFSKTEEAFPLFLSTEFIICFLLIFIPTIFMGMTLPLAVEIVSSANKKIGFSVGRVFSVNTFGNVIGVIIAGIILIPAIGIRGTFVFGIALNLLAALLVIWKHELIMAQFKAVSALVIVFMFVVYAFVFNAFNPDVMVSGVFRRFDEKPPKSYEEFLNMLSGEKILFYKEGAASTVAVTQWISNEDNKSLIINGKPDGSSYYDMPTQVMLGQVPMMLHKNPKNVFVVGLGTGTTVGSVLTHDVDHVVCAEISKEVINAAKYFEKENRHCLSDKRLKIYNEDAVTLLRILKNKFDVIISEPSNPWIAGIGNLFSKEYFSKCYDKLNDDGIMVQWFHLYEASDNVVKLVLNTFSSVFKHSQLWTGVGSDIILVGSKSEISLDPDLLQKKFNLPAVKKDFSRIDIYSPFTFLCNQTVSSKNVFVMSSDYPVNSEILPLLEFLAPKSFYVSSQSSYTYKFDERFDTLSTGLLVKDYVKLFPPSQKEMINAAEYALNTSKSARFAYGISKYLLGDYPDDYSINEIYSKAYEALGIYNIRIPSLEKLIKLYPDSSNSINELNNLRLLQDINASTFLKVFSIKELGDEFQKIAVPDSLSKTKVMIQLAKAYLQNGEMQWAKALIDTAETYLTGSPALAKQLKMDDYYYVSSMTALYYKENEKLFKNYLALLNTNPKYESLLKLRRSVSWYLKHESKSTL